MSAPGSISVVVAFGGGLRPAAGCVDSFRSQLDPGRGDEVLIEEGSAETLVPELWARGIERASGEIVALTVGSMEAAPGWADGIRSEMAQRLAGVGGAIEPGAELDLVGRAVHLCRYSSYLRPFEEGDADGLPGDNAAYRRSDLESCREIWKLGFWETEVDPVLRRNGGRLKMTSRIALKHVSGAGVAAFCRNRIRHGMRSGSHRAGRLSRGGRMLRAAASPLVPFVLLRRIGRRASSRGRGRDFRRAWPIVFLFLCVWSAGEAAGYVRGPS
ncbi:MAG: glycosyltransferase [Thermoanaerobaculia bacterium]